MIGGDFNDIGSTALEMLLKTWHLSQTYTIIMVPTCTGKTGKPGKMSEDFG